MVKNMKMNKIAVIAERYVALGFKLIGITNVFIEEDITAVKLLSKFMVDKEYDLIIAEDNIQVHMSNALLRDIEISITPLVVFIPSSESNIPIEPIDKMAKRILGVNIKGVK